MKVGRLNLKILNIEGRASISTDLTDDEAFGIYAYEFEDGDWYVGKSTDIRDRHVQHMHEYRHKNPPWIPKKMLWAHIKGDEQALDEAETAAIARFETEGYSLKNVAKTGRPRGNNAVKVYIEGTWGVEIPWDRENIPQSTHEYSFAEEPRMKERFERLESLPEYEQILDIYRAYVFETIPAPADTAGALWVATALPTTRNSIGYGTISCQNVETLVLFKEGAFDSPYAWGFFNAKPADGINAPDLGGFWTDSYKNLGLCLQYQMPTLYDLQVLFRCKEVLDCCYRVNSELFRKGASMMKKYNNPYLVEAILEAGPIDQEYLHAETIKASKLKVFRAVD